MSYISKNKYYTTRKIYYEKNKENILEHNKQYYLKNIELITKKQLDYNRRYNIQKKIDRQQESIKQYYIENPIIKYRSEIKIYI